MTNIFQQLSSTTKTYFKFKVIDRKLFIGLIITAFFRTLCFITLPFIASEIVDGIVAGDYNHAELFAGLFLLSGVLYLTFRHFYYRIALQHYNFAHDKFQHLMLDKVATFDNNYTDEFPTAFVTNVAFSSISYAPEFPTQLVNLFADFFALTLECIILTLFDSTIGIATIAFALISLFALSYNLRQYEHYAREQLAIQDRATDLMDEVIDGRREVKVFNLRDELDQLLAENQAERREIYNKRGRFRDRANVIIPAFLGFGRVVIYALAIILILSEPEHNVSALVLAVGYYADIEDYFANIRQRFSAFSESAIHIHRIHEILSYKTPTATTSGTYNRMTVSGKLELVDVSFSRHGLKILRDVNLKIKPHRLICIAGPSGAGKSILLRLLARFYKPTRGKILLDDINISRYTKAAYADNVTLATNKPFIFDLTIRENLNLIDENERRQVEICKLVGLHDRIMKLKDGYDTRLVAGSADFSPTERQLFALARTLLTGAEVLLFDEITAALDVKNSKQIFTILKELKKSHTIIAVTHKPYLMEMSDEIIVMKKGRVIKRGSYEQVKNFIN